jgi:hypothetical protein
MPEDNNLFNQTIAGVAGNTANGIIGTAMGLLLEKHNDARQIAQQTKLNALQVGSQEQLTDYNTAKQLQMWHDTNAAAQVAEYNKAGLNPALMYGMGGGGGSTAQIAQGSVSGADAPKGGHEIADEQAIGINRMQQTMQLQLLEAQKENIQASTAQMQAQTTKTAGVDTDVATAQVGKVTADTGNAIADTKLKDIETQIGQIDANYQGASLENRLDMIAQLARKLTGEASTALIQGNVDEATKTTKIKQIQAEFIGKLLQNGLTQQQTAESKSRTAVNVQQINNMTQEIMQKWDTLSNDTERVNLLRQQVGYDTDISNKLVQSITSILTLSAVK